MHQGTIQGKYFVWEIQNAGRGVTASRVMPNGDQVSVQLERPAEGPILYQGIWQPAETVVHTELTALMGVCLLDARWQVIFPAKDKANPPARRALALPRERSDAFDRIGNKGQRPTQVHLPKAPGKYHRHLIEWQGQQVRLLRPDRILYHLPADEYHYYIREMERVIGTTLPEMHHALDVFAERLRRKIEREFGEEMYERVEFVRPMQSGSETPEESFMAPYAHPERFRIQGPTIGIEDLVELRLAYEVGRAGGPQIPVLCGVLDMPHPYTSKELDEVTTMAL